MVFSIMIILFRFGSSLVVVFMEKFQVPFDCGSLYVFIIDKSFLVCIYRVYGGSVGLFFFLFAPSGLMET